MDTVNIHEAKTQLSRLIERVCAGEEIIIARGGRPVARLAPLAPRRPRRLGLLKGKIWVAKDFNAPLPDDLLDLFEGKSEPKRKAPKR
ncbi:MAG: type II toxin-antitoxin system Phd/YefM family antitoxin [Betaproteobacteria bacterium]|nr:type II toxin-antitoxin system Phd/YefM family antitoxin [Betaproteobacteria bacterium]MSQ87912.1 type II toxin-antitoxin system Phd/YefM family antitoxin [Betaproteobacteria bacterium]